MPTQSDFERVAGEFDRSAAQFEELFTEPSRLLSSDIVLGGLLTSELNVLFAHVRVVLDRHASELRDLAAACRSRAAASAAYQSQLRAFEAASDAYQGELRRWTTLSDAHDEEPTIVPPPGPRPSPPGSAPVAPEWTSVASAH